MLPMLAATPLQSPSLRLFSVNAYSPQQTNFDADPKAIPTLHTVLLPGEGYLARPPQERAPPVPLESD